MIFQKVVPTKGMCFERTVPAKGMVFQKTVPTKGVVFTKTVPIKGKGFLDLEEHPHQNIKQVPPPGGGQCECVRIFIV